MNNKYTKLEIKIKKQLSGDFLGSFQSAFKGLGVEFDSLREYVPGDNIKSIDWKTTAKLGKVHVKNYEEEKDLKILFIIDNSKSLSFGSEYKTKKDTVEDVFFLLAQSAISTGHTVGVQINNQFIDFKRGKTNIIKAIKILEKSEPSTKKSERITKINIKNTLIFYITDNTSPNTFELKYWNINNEVVVINIFDYFENNISNDGFEAHLDKKLKNVYFGKKENTKNYKILRKNKIHELQKTLRKTNIEYIFLDDKSNIFIEFYKFFNKKIHKCT